jgi:hypothetical protein
LSADVRVDDGGVIEGEDEGALGEGREGMHAAGDGPGRIQLGRTVFVAEVGNFLAVGAEDEQVGGKELLAV